MAELFITFSICCWMCFWEYYSSKVSVWYAVFRFSPSHRCISGHSRSSITFCSQIRSTHSKKTREAHFCTDHTSSSKYYSQAFFKTLFILLWGL